VQRTGICDDWEIVIRLPGTEVKLKVDVEIKKQKLNSERPA
jgi:hypothetical protein